MGPWDHWLQFVPPLLTDGLKDGQMDGLRMLHIVMSFFDCQVSKTKSKTFIAILIDHECWTMFLLSKCKRLHLDIIFNRRESHDQNSNICPNIKLIYKHMYGAFAIDTCVFCESVRQS